MAVFEIEANGRRFEVEAPSIDAAMQAFGGPDQMAQRFATAHDDMSADRPELQTALQGRVPQRGSLIDPLMQGMTFGFSDEIMGGIGGVAGMIGGKPFSEGYERMRDASRGNLEAVRERQPVASAAAELGGAIATLPVAGSLNIVRGAGWAGRAANAAATGGVYGGLYGTGASSGGIADRALGGAIGAGVGAATGGVASPVIDVLGAGARSVGQGIASTVRGLRNPEAEAARRVALARQRDVSAGARVMTPAEEAAATSAGQPVVNIDRGGETVRALGRSAANTSPEAREALSRTVSDRFEGQGDRATGFLRGLVRTHADATATREALEQAARQSRGGFYRRAYSDGANGILTPRIEQLTQSPVMERALRDAAESIRNKGATGRATNPVGPSGTPTLEYWDQVQRSLRSAWNVASRQGDNELAGDIDAIRRTLLDELDTAVPSFATARGVARTLFNADDALEAGQKFVTSNMPMSEARRAFAKMTPEEKDLFREGFVSDFIDKIERSGDRRNVVPQIWGSKQARAKIEMVLGPQKAKELETFMNVETLMDAARGAVQGNSTTVRQLAEMGLAGGAGTIASGGLNLTDPTFWLTAALVRGGRAGQSRINEQVARRVGELLASSDPAVFQRGMKMVSNSRALSDALRRAATRAGGPSAPRPLEINVPINASGALPAAAEDNQSQ